MAGSHMIDDTFDLSPSDAGHKAVLVLGVGPDKEKESGYTRTYELIRAWAERNPDHQVLIKAHPRSQVPFWKDASDSLPNLQVLPKECDLAQALARASSTSTGNTSGWGRRLPRRRWGGSRCRR